MSLAIGQGDYVYYTDTSSGNPTGWNWYFVGGSPTGSNAQNPVVRYLSPSPYLGYPATLTISKGGLVSSKTENSAIYVAPESLYIEVSAEPDPNEITMSSNVYYSISFGTTGSVDYYKWLIPGATGYLGGTGFTGPGSILGQNITVNEWYDVTGYYSGAAYSTYTTFATVFGYSFLGNVTANNVQVTYYKNGPLESFNFADPNLYNPIVSYYGATVLPYNTASVGLPGNGIVLSIDSYNGDLNNLYFRSHGELLYYITCNMDVSSNFPANSGIIPMMQIVSASGLTLMGVPQTGWELLPRYLAGDYMITEDIATYFSNTLYVGDHTGVLGKLLLPNRFWTESQISSIVFEECIASQTSKNMELFPGYTPLASLFFEDGYNGASGGRGGCCLPSQSIAIGDVIIYIDLYYSGDGSIQNIDPGLTTTISVTISDITINGGFGNSPDGRLVLAQDTGNGPGIASLIQTELDNYFVGNLGNPMNVFMSAEASPEYAFEYALGQYDVNVFNGLKLTIRKNDPINPGGGPYLVKAVLRDNFATSQFMLPAYIKTSAFGFSGPLLGNWTCLGLDYLSNPAQEYQQNLPFPYRGFSYGAIPY